VADLNSQGQFLWATSGGGVSDEGRVIAVGPQGEVVVGGNFNDTLSLGGLSLTSKGSADVFVYKIQ